MRQSELDQAGWKDEEEKYLIRYFMTGVKDTAQPRNWPDRLEALRDSLGWDPVNSSFARTVAQACTIYISKEKMEEL